MASTEHRLTEAHLEGALRLTRSANWNQDADDWRMMLALGRALMAKPRLLLLDEPSLGLAPLIVKEIFRVIADLRRTGVSILLVEQNARAALQVADYGYVLELGEIALEGPASQLADDPKVIESYLGLGGAAQAAASRSRPAAN